LCSFREACVVILIQLSKILAGYIFLKALNFSLLGSSSFSLDGKRSKKIKAVEKWLKITSFT
jgi:hypothetical protein